MTSPIEKMKSRLRFSGDVIAGDPVGPSTTHDAVASFNQHGALWIENALPRQFVRGLQEAYSAKYTSLSKTKLRKRYAVVGDGRYMITVSVKPPFNSPELYANPTLMPILQQLLGADCVISSFGSVVAFPGADAQSVHFDYPPLFESEEVCAALPPHAITLVVPLVDLDEMTGSTAIWEGSHARVGARDQLRKLVDESSWQGSTMPLPRMGDVYLMDFRLIHGGTANRSDHPRPILYIVYSRPWFREDMNFDEQPPIKISRKQLKRVPKDLRYLFSWAPTNDH
jgi:ectoine hydroxylase-related dioxygenase (phytanoyl-CoA dioxygenase family)